MKVSFACLLVLLGACGNKVEKEMIAKHTALKDKMCACKDKACAQQVDAELTKYVEEMAKSSANDTKATSDAFATKLVGITMAYMDCQAKFVGPAEAASPGAGSGKIDPASAAIIAKGTELSDKMCACKDKDCAAKVTDEYSTWAAEAAKDTDAATTQAMQKSALAYADCLTKALGPSGMETASGSAVARSKDPLVAETILKSNIFMTQMCECKDNACADKVNDEMKAWGADMKKRSAEHPPRPTPEEQQTMTDVGLKYGDCSMRLKKRDAP